MGRRPIYANTEMTSHFMNRARGLNSFCIELQIGCEHEHEVELLPLGVHPGRFGAIYLKLALDTAGGRFSIAEETIRTAMVQRQGLGPWEPELAYVQHLLMETMPSQISNLRQFTLEMRSVARTPFVVNWKVWLQGLITVATQLRVLRIVGDVGRYISLVDVQLATTLRFLFIDEVDLFDIHVALVQTPCLEELRCGNLDIDVTHFPDLQFIVSAADDDCEPPRERSPLIHLMRLLVDSENYGVIAAHIVVHTFFHIPKLTLLDILPTVEVEEVVFGSSQHEEHVLECLKHLKVQKTLQKLTIMKDGQENRTEFGMVGPPFLKHLSSTSNAGLVNLPKLTKLRLFHCLPQLEFYSARNMRVLVKQIPRARSGAAMASSFRFTDGEGGNSTTRTCYVDIEQDEWAVRGSVEW